MDARLHGYHPANRQSWAPNNAGGAAELTVPPPKMDEAPTFEHYTKQARLWLISAGQGGPDSVADGRTVGETGHLSNEAPTTLPLNFVRNITRVGESRGVAWYPIRALGCTLEGG